eukprot:scaffold836_cov189-Alexandrium_tamarense.AAC.32
MWCCGFAVVVAVLLCKVEVGVVGASAGQPAWSTDCTATGVPQINGADHFRPPASILATILNDRRIGNLHPDPIPPADIFPRVI